MVLSSSRIFILWISLYVPYCATITWRSYSPSRAGKTKHAFVRSRTIMYESLDRLWCQGCGRTPIIFIFYFLADTSMMLREQTIDDIASHCWNPIWAAASKILLKTGSYIRAIHSYILKVFQCDPRQSSSHYSIV